MSYRAARHQLASYRVGRCPIVLYLSGGLLLAYELSGALCRLAGLAGGPEDSLLQAGRACMYVWNCEIDIERAE